MKVAFICPIPLLRKYGDCSDTHLVLANLVLSEPKYRDFYLRMSRNGDLVILDNGVMETGKPLEWEMMRAAADAVEATEVVLPDYPGDALATAQSYRLFSDIHKRHVFIPQGRDILDWYWCLGAGTGTSYLTLGIPKSVESFIPGFLPGIDRPALVRMLYERGLLRVNGPFVHLFGIHKNPLEITRYSGIPVRSVDMKFPILAGQLGYRLSPTTGLERGVLINHFRADPHMDFRSDIDTPEIRYNIKVVQGWAREHDKSLKGVSSGSKEKATRAKPHP